MAAREAAAARLDHRGPAHRTRYQLELQDNIPQYLEGNHHHGGQGARPPLGTRLLKRCRGLHADDEGPQPRDG